MAALGALVAILPFISHITMFIAIRRYNNQVGDIVPSQQLSIILGREKRVAKDMFIVMVVLWFCAIPKLVVVIFSQSLGNLYNYPYLWSTTLTLLNSCINPVLYLKRNSALRGAVRSVMYI